VRPTAPLCRAPLPLARLLEGGQDHVEVVWAHGLAVVPRGAFIFPDQLDRDIGQAESDGDPVVAVEIAVARVETHPQRDADAVGGDALAEAVKMGGGVDDGGGSGDDLAVDGPVARHEVGGEVGDDTVVRAQVAVADASSHGPTLRRRCRSLNTLAPEAGPPARIVMPVIVVGISGIYRRSGRGEPHRPARASESP